MGWEHGLYGVDVSVKGISFHDDKIVYNSYGVGAADASITLRIIHPLKKDSEAILIS